MQPPPTLADPARNRTYRPTHTQRRRTHTQGTDRHDATHSGPDPSIGWGPLSRTPLRPSAPLLCATAVSRLAVCALLVPWRGRAHPGSAARARGGLRPPRAPSRPSPLPLRIPAESWPACVRCTTCSGCPIKCPDRTTQTGVESLPSAVSSIADGRRQTAIGRRLVSGICNRLSETDPEQTAAGRQGGHPSATCWGSDCSLVV